MMNQFDNCSCFGLDPEKPDKAALESESKHQDIIWIKFNDEFDCDDLSAETLSTMFSSFGDFHLFKDTRKSCILNFYYYEKTQVEERSSAGFIKLISQPQNMEKFHVQMICPYDQSQKFVAHNRLE